jgi:hypothetical protein
MIRKQTFGPEVPLAGFSATVTDATLRLDAGQMPRRSGSAGRSFAN